MTAQTQNSSGSCLSFDPFQSFSHIFTGFILRDLSQDLKRGAVFQSGEGGKTLVPGRRWRKKCKKMLYIFIKSINYKCTYLVTTLYYCIMNMLTFFTDDYHTTRRRYPQLSWHRELNWGYKPITGSITSDVGVGSVAACFSFNWLLLRSTDPG